MKKGIFFLSLLYCSFAAAQDMSLAESIREGQANASVVKVAERSLNTRKLASAAAKNNYLPKIDLLAGYQHLGAQAQLNLVGEKENAIQYATGQISQGANAISQQLTGNPLPNDIRQIIEQTSRDILTKIYPTDNPNIGQRDYLLAGLFIRQPIYLGGKLKAERTLAEQQLVSGKINLDNARQITAYQIALQYIQVAYYNAMLEKQQELLEAHQKNTRYAENLQKAELLPPYLKNWATIAEKQAESGLENLRLEKENALLTLKSLMGKDLNAPLLIGAKLPTAFAEIQPEKGAVNADIRLLESKKTEAETAANITSTLAKPNIFAIGTAQFFTKDLPIILPPWLIGIELQWTLFDAQKKSRHLAARALVEESQQLIDQKKQATELALRTTQNKLISLQKQTETLDAARQEAYTTTRMVRLRMENDLSSIKDVNDALRLQYESEKLYYTSLAVYHAALATYYYLQGTPEAVTHYIP